MTQHIYLFYFFQILIIFSSDHSGDVSRNCDDLFRILNYLLDFL